VRRKLIYLTAILIVVAAGSFVAVKLHSPSSAGVSSNGELPAYLSLSAPAFAQGVASTQFPYTDAGIACYAKFEKTIDLQKVQRSLRVVEAATADYVVGVVELSGSLEAQWPHVYVTSDGWVLVYYSKSDPASRIVQWSAYSNGTITSTTLRDAMLSIGRTAALDISRLDQDLRYFHFQYPEATNLMLVFETATGNASDSFHYTIPSALLVYECAYSLRFGGGGCYDRLWVDNDNLQETYYGGDIVDVLGAKYLASDQRHAVIVGSGCRSAMAALCFLYR